MISSEVLCSLHPYYGRSSPIVSSCYFLMVLSPPRHTRTATHVPYTTLFLSTVPVPRHDDRSAAVPSPATRDRRVQGAAADRRGPDLRVRCAPRHPGGD